MRARADIEARWKGGRRQRASSAQSKQKADQLSHAMFGGNFLLFLHGGPVGIPPHTHPGPEGCISDRVVFWEETCLKRRREVGRGGGRRVVKSLVRSVATRPRPSTPHASALPHSAAIDNWQLQGLSCKHRLNSSVDSPMRLEKV